MIAFLKSMYNKYREIIVYLIVGVLTTLFSWIFYYIPVFTFLNPDDPIQLQIANIISWIAGVIFAYFTNRKYVFLSKDKNVIMEALRFTASRLTTLFLDMFVMWLLVTVLDGNDKIAKIISTVLVMIGNYVFSKLLVFKKEK